MGRKVRGGIFCLNKKLTAKCGNAKRRVHVRKTLEICYFIYEPVYLSHNGFIIRKQKEAVMQMAISVVAKEFIQTRHFHCFCSTFCVPELFLPFVNSNN